MGLTCKQVGKMRGMLKRVENELLKAKQAEKRKEKGKSKSNEES